MLICFDARMSRAWHAGTGRLTVALLDELCQLGGDHEYLVLLHPAAPPIPLARPDLVRAETSSLAPVSVAQYAAFAKWARERRVDLVFHPHQLSMPWSSGARSIGMILDLLPLLFPDQFTRLQVLYYRWVVAMTAGRRDQLLAISESGRADIVRLLKIPADRIDVLPLAPAPAMRPVSKPDALALTNRFGLHRPFVLYVGNARPHKNVPALIDAFARAELVATHDLVVVGAEDSRERERDYSVIRSKVESAGLTDAVRFVGGVTDEELAGLCRLAAALALVSLYEGFGLPALEAMACGTPVVCSDLGALPEVAAGSAILVDPSSIESIAQGLRRVVADPAHTMRLREAGLARAAGFSWRKSATMLLDVFERTARA